MTLVLETLSKLHYINVGDNGTFKPSGKPDFDTTAADVDKMIELLRQHNQKRILLYFHGGLVNAANGMKTAERIVRYAKWDSSPCPYPISFVWETGLMETLRQNFDTIGQSKFFKKLLVKIIKVAGKKLGVDIDDNLVGSKGISQMSDQQILAELEKEAPFDKTFENAGKRSASLKAASVANIDNEVFYNTVVKPEVQAELEDEIGSDPELIALAAAEKPAAEKELMKVDGDAVSATEKGLFSFTKLIAAAVKITIAVVKRHLKKRDHGFYPTIIEEIFREIYIADIGSWVWGSMKNKAKEMWSANDFSGAPETWHAGSYLLKKLKDYQDEAGELTIDVVGHSAGSIVICELIDAIKQRNIGLKFRHIVFMAPACRCDLFDRTVMKNPELFQSLRIFTMSDAYEEKDHMIPVLYPRSLLYFISGLLEKDDYDAYILGMQRHIIGNRPYDQVELLNGIKDYLLQNDRMVYAVTADGAAEGFRSIARKHGNFDNDLEPTMDSLFYLLKQ